MRKIPLQFSDIDFGTEEFGFIPVEPGEDPDDADARYLKHLAAQGVRGRIDRMGNLVVEGSPRRGTLRLTEGQLRQIIRQEVRALREAPRRPSAALHAGGSGARGLPAGLELGRLPLTPDEEYEFEQGGMRTLDRLEEETGYRVDSLKDLRGAGRKAMVLRKAWREYFGPGLYPA